MNNGLSPFGGYRLSIFERTIMQTAIIIFISILLALTAASLVRADRTIRRCERENAELDKKLRELQRINAENKLLIAESAARNTDLHRDKASLEGSVTALQSELADSERDYKVLERVSLECVVDLAKMTALCEDSYESNDIKVHPFVETTQKRYNFDAAEALLLLTELEEEQQREAVEAEVARQMEEYR